MEDQDGGDDNVEEDDDNRQEVFSRRKLGSNWDRYEESERKEPDDDTPTQRGADFHVLLESAEYVESHLELELRPQPVLSVNAKGAFCELFDPYLSSLCFAHIVRLVMPYSKRLRLCRGYLIVRGRRCFQESLFWPIKVAMKSRIRHGNLPFSSLSKQTFPSSSLAAVAMVVSAPSRTTRDDGDSFTQFRFLEEKDWEMDSFAAGQMSAVFVDLPALAQTLQQVPLHQRLHLEAELVQVFTPVELPTMKPATKQETPKMSTFTPASATFQGLDPKQKVPASTSPVDDDEELDQLLSLQKPVLDVSGDQTDVVTEEESAGPEKACEEMKEVIEDKMEEVEDEVVTPPESASVKQEMTEEDLEDWLDSMIS
ncbi:hypothetical protein F2P81_024331 [Scophthalmus maximus]|uniref:Cell death regulator Aven n=1 Tax=Scophthalmus maximus TaxID=52904 RepID=A0A6A4RX98_SCOMX|nr:hypothetical protein F2P81_024331 [Scophthalmus maximus]